jgi:hypothetical protein
MKNKIIKEILERIQGSIDSAVKSGNKYDDWINGNVAGLVEAIDIITFTVLELNYLKKVKKNSKH